MIVSRPEPISCASIPDLWIWLVESTSPKLLKKWTAAQVLNLRVYALKLECTLWEKEEYTLLKKILTLQLQRYWISMMTKRPVWQSSGSDSIINVCSSSSYRRRKQIIYNAALLNYLISCHTCDDDDDCTDAFRYHVIPCVDARPI